MSSNKVAHFRGTYLGLTETFIYQYLSNHERYDALIGGIQATNIDKFPFEPRYILLEHPHWDPRFWIWGALEKFDVPGITYSYYQYVINKSDPDILHAHFGPTGIQLVPNRTDNRPLVTSFYGYDASLLLEQQEGIKTDYEHLFTKGDLFLVEGPAMKKKLLDIGCPETKISIQRIAIDTAQIEPVYPEPDEDLTLLIVGRFVEKKGIPDGIKAFASAFDGEDGVELRIVGGESGEFSQDELESLAAKEGVDKQITFTGYLDYDDYLGEIRNCDVLLAPSKQASSGDSEGGAPTVLLEAQASGKPVVSTTHADIPYVVEDGVTGRLATPGDVEGLTAALQWCQTHQDELNEMGRAGRQRMINRHDVDELVLELEEKYDVLLERT